MGVWHSKPSYGLSNFSGGTINFVLSAMLCMFLHSILFFLFHLDTICFIWKMVAISHGMYVQWAWVETVHLAQFVRCSRNVKMSSYQYVSCDKKDKTFSPPTAVSSKWKSHTRKDRLYIGTGPRSRNYMQSIIDHTSATILITLQKRVPTTPCRRNE